MGRNGTVRYHLVDLTWGEIRLYVTIMGNLKWGEMGLYVTIMGDLTWGEMGLYVTISSI